MKYQCLGNDFIITKTVPKNIEILCDQHKGVGADGLIVIKDTISFFNKDGSKALFCGNGIRCAAKYIHDNINKNLKTFVFEGKEYSITNNNNLYTLILPISKIKKNKKLYFVSTGVEHVVLFKKPNYKTAIKLFKKYDKNITFFFDDKAKTYEKGVGFTNGCGSGLISIMSILYLENNITDKIISSDNEISKLSVCNNKVLLESKVQYIYKGEIQC